MSIEKRLDTVEEAILIMKDLLVSHNERLENYFFALEKERQEREESNKDFNFKLNALIDAQIRNETEIDKVKESIEKLSEASQSQLQRIEKLEKK